MTGWPLPEATVERRPPSNLTPGDEGLFAHEYRRSFPRVEALRGSWDAWDDGMLLAPGRPRVEPSWFQAGLPRGVSGLKVSAKGWWAWTRPRDSWEGTKPPLVITDEFSNGYFHWLADALPKLWGLGDQRADYQLVLPSYARRFPYMVESLAPWPELATHVLDPGTRTELPNAVLLPALAPTGNYRPEWIRRLAAAWRDHVRPQPPSRKLYISRAGAPWRKIRNEDEVWSVLERRGFEKVLLENLGFADQVKLLAETLVCVSNHGAGLTNLMFQRPGTRVVEIRLRGDSHNNCYYALANAADVEYNYVLADAADRESDSHTADLRLDARALRVLEALT